MQVVGFNYKKISAEKSPQFKLGPIKTNIQFLDPEKDKLDILKDQEIIKFPFKFDTFYEDNELKEAKHGEVTLNGEVIVSISKDESKEIWKSWKKKVLPTNFNEFLINFIFKKCTLKALSLEEDLSLPLHFSFPRAQLKKD